jgi:predicted HTH domain antitoxin
MAVTLHIPDSITVALRLPEGEIEERLRLELALALYGQGILSFGKAAELAGTDRSYLAEQLSTRAIPRHYGTEELAEDLNYARGE